MFNFIFEAVVTAFCVGGVVGAVLTMHLMNPRKQAEKRTQEVLEP